MERGILHSFLQRGSVALGDGKGRDVFIAMDLGSAMFGVMSGVGLLWFVRIVFAHYINEFLLLLKGVVWHSLL